MPETPDLKALAERYLDLWEEQFTAAAADPALASAMAAWLAPWRAMSQGVPPVAPAAPQEPLRKSDEPAARRSNSTGAAAENPRSEGRAAAAGPSSIDRGGGLERLLERLDRIEQRLDKLERKRAEGSAKSRRGAKPETR